MRFTRSRDGQLRADIQLKFRIGYDQLVHAAMSLLFDDGDTVNVHGEWFEPDTKPSRAAIERRLREEILDRGSNWQVAIADDIPNGVWDDIERVAQRTVRRLWPDVAPPEVKS